VTRFSTPAIGKKLFLVALLGALCSEPPHLGGAAAAPDLNVAALRADRQSAGLGPLQPIEWLTGASQSPRMSPTELHDALTQLANRPVDRHLVVQFDGPVDSKLRAQFAASGLRLFTYVGSNAFFASTTPGVDAANISQTPSLARIVPIERAWKMHPLLLVGEAPSYSVVEPQKGDVPPVVGAYVLFHADIALVPDGVNLAVTHGAMVRSNLETVNGLVIELPFANIAALADEDSVQWIEPPLPRMVEVNNSNRVITGANVVQAPPYGLNGSGVTVLVYDGGFALAGHQDFGGRLTVRDSSGLSNHATHVSGTVGGSGAASGGNFRGMAPAVTIQSYGFEYDGSGIFLYSNPGDMEDDYDGAINSFGADISNNSIGTNTCANGFPCSITGDYGVTSALIDNVVKGSLGAPFRVVWANGNERSCPFCPGEHQNGYHSTAPPACAKNHLTVGALNSNDDSQTSFTSWGPCDDGRLKPDVSAPGCQSNDDGGVTSCSSSGGYTVFCGTSMASPTVCGLGSLLLQDFRAQYPGEPDFRNSTLRAMFAHTAQERGNPGPDYQFGYGSVRIQPAVDFLRTGNFLEQSVDQGETYAVLVVVAPGETVLKATLAWDDPAAAPNVNPSLVNDLDLVVFDPSSNQHFPWTLNPASPATPAVQNQADHKNNIEQVFVSNPTPGAWRVEIRGFNVPAGSQPFSLCASPLLVNCSTQGVISLDRAKYACESTATIQVVDCDLNTDDTTIETISVTVDSNTEPAGESVVLTETAAETAAFRGDVNLSVTDAAGVLHVTAGDTVTATYIDADDGLGGTNVVVQAAAPVDCQGPVISNVQATNIGPYTATITFDTNEPAQGSVRYGGSCGALTDQLSGSGFNAAHSIGLTGLSEDSTYYFAVEAVDQAGNASTDNNGGTCYSFVTPDIPNYFTEEFGGDNDLDNLSLTFVPDGSFDFYDACAEAITALPVDPTGGTVLTFPPPQDDEFTMVTLAGGATVSVYGVGFSSFFVGTNGYVTFGAGDEDYTETPAEHFALRRVTALFDDLHPGQGGSISRKQLSDRIVITWQNVPEYNAGNSNTFQIDLAFDGTIRISYLSIAASDGLAGLSEGNGLPVPFFETDLSASSCIPDCNHNGIPDPEDISGGTSEDCNSNLVPDECEDLGPSIGQHPSSASPCVNGSVTFGVNATGLGSLSYQWRKDLVNIAGATANTYTIDPVQPADAGSYTVVVTDICDSAASNPATLTVLDDLDCDDGNACTTDICDADAGCLHPFNSVSCDDGNACTAPDACSAGVCTGTAIVVLFADLAPPGGDGFLDVSDIGCVLDGFADFAACPQGDLIPCGGNGYIDLSDVLVSLSAFEGYFACPHPCPP